jgi:hypothetical protein
MLSERVFMDFDATQPDKNMMMDKGEDERVDD